MNVLNGNNYKYPIIFGTELICKQVSYFSSRFCKNPGTAYWDAIKRVFLYLKEAMTSGETNDVLTSYCDAVWAADLDQRKSSTGYLFTMYGGGFTMYSKVYAFPFRSKSLWLHGVDYKTLHVAELVN